MILADKIVELRKKSGWSQEELADKLNVSRQAVSKWESAAAVPSLEKILQLAELFGVTTDYLLKDEMENRESESAVRTPGVKRISMEEANRYIAQRKKSSWRIAVATFLCILSPITLLLLCAVSEMPNALVSDTVAAGIGLAALFVCVLCAVPVYVFCGFQNAPYAFLEKNVPFELEYGVRDMIMEKMNAFRASYVISNMIAVCLCIVSPVPLILAALTENTWLIIIMLSLTIAIVGVGVFLFIVGGVQNASMQKLLKEGDYTPEGKRKSAVKGSVGSAYWALIVAIYLVWSFLTNQWQRTWLVFAIGGILFPALMAVCNILIHRVSAKDASHERED